MPRSRHRVGRPYRRAKAQMHATYGYTCHLCGHGGAGEADHLVPIRHDSTQPINPHAMRPAHGSNSPCPTCPPRNGRPRCCNQERGTKPIESVFTPAFDW